MNCPYCKEKMNEGIIPSDSYSLKWISQENNKGTLLQWFSKGIELSDLLYDHGVKAFFCSDCNKIIIDVEDKIKKYKA